MKHWLTSEAESQNKLVLHWLQKYDSITAIQAVRAYGIMRLSARINDLRRAGHEIVSEICYDQTNRSRHWAKYSLKKSAK